MTDPTDPTGSNRGGSRRRSQNSSNLSRAARRLAAAEGISYMAARERVIAARAAKGPDAAPVPQRFAVQISDGIGFSADVWLLEDLFPEMEAAVTADPGAGAWAGDTWTIAALDVRRGDLVFADALGRFELSGGSLGNPGCDECGSADAAVRDGDTYLCSVAAAERGLGSLCGHCGGLLTSDDVALHARGCPVHPLADADREAVRRCPGGPHLGGPEHPDGEAFCSLCGAQFTDIEHGVDR